MTYHWPPLLNTRVVRDGERVLPTDRIAYLAKHLLPCLPAGKPLTVAQVSDMTGLAPGPAALAMRLASQRGLVQLHTSAAFVTTFTLP